MIQASLKKPNLELDSLAKSTLIALAIQITGVILAYFLEVVLARWMGKAEYGIYTYVISWSILLSVPAKLGFPITILRYVPQYKTKKEWGHLWGIIYSSFFFVLITSFLVYFFATGVIFYLSHNSNFIYAKPLKIGIWILILHALMHLQQDLARGSDDIPLAYAPSKILQPILILSCGLLWLQTVEKLTSSSMIIICGFALSGVVLFQFYLLWKKLHQTFETATPIYENREWLGVSLSLLLQGAFIIIINKTDVLMIGAFLGPEKAGVYSAAVETAMWVGFILSTVNMVVAPAFSTLYTEGDIEGLQIVIAKVGIWIFIPSLVIASGLVIFSKPVLGLFGTGFMGSVWELRVLVLGKLVSTLCGSVCYLMMMTSHHQKSAFVFGCAAVVNIVLNAIGIPLLGSMGAAIATAISVALWNVWLAILVIKHLNVNPSIFYYVFPTQHEQ